MKVFLDDERPCPHGWIAAKTAPQAISLLETGKVTHISLDHDLGPPEAGTGYDVACWIEMKSRADPSFNPPLYQLHSANPIGVARMALALRGLPKFDMR